MKEIYEIFRRNFPTIVRRTSTVEALISDKDNKIFEKRNKKGKLIGVAIVNKCTIYLLCVDKRYRNQGIGEDLLNKCEEYIKQSGYDKVVVGVGNSYLTPGVPTSVMPYVENLKPHKLFKKIGGIFLTNDALIRYSMQLGMLRILLNAKAISDKEYSLIKRRLMQDYEIYHHFEKINEKP